MVRESKGIAEVVDGMDGGGNGKWVVKGQQKTHTWLERVGFMFKVHRFGTLYFAAVHEVSIMYRHLLVALHGFEPRTCGL